MRVSQFWTLVEGEFGGPYGRMLVRDQVLASLRGRTAEQALSDGVDPRQVWSALCEEMDVPVARRWGPPLRPGDPGYVAPADPGRRGGRTGRSGRSG